MTDSELARHWARRKQRASQMIEAPQSYKICDQCRAICAQHVGTCPLCGAYRFNGSPAFVIETAKAFARHPFPVTAGVVPRV